MFRPDDLPSYRWRQLHERLDKAVAEAARLYLQQLTSRHIRIDPKRWSDELDELRLQREPDYETPGLPLVYALKYMPRRVISIVGSLLSILDGWYPTSVLDIGSGTGSTALALDLLNLPRHINLLGIEPSREMIAFAECSRYRARVSAHYRQGSIVGLGGNDMSLESFDLLVFSACFPYGFCDWGPLSRALGDYDQHKDRMILVIEPDAKSDILDAFQRCLKRRGWPTRRLCCHGLPELMKRDDLPLREMLDVWRRLGLQDLNRPRTWWNPPDDRFLIANPQPSWPSASMKIPGLRKQLQAVGVVPGQEQARAG
jgi:SAM-dependent methyltransferase